MKSTKFLLLLLIFSVVCFHPQLKAYSHLTVSDPQDWSKYGQGSIDEAVITIEPKGVYMEYNFYLTFSANGHGFTVDDTLEVNYDFSLPENSIVHDSWLWFNGEIIVADIMDRWKAYGIYESIVNRRRDPSILYKNQANRYSLQIFPMAGNESRKVKISVLVPTKWQGDKLYAPIPLHLFQQSYINLEKVKVITWENEYFKNPVLEGLETDTFFIGNDDKFGEYKYSYIENGSFYNSVNICFDSPMEDGVFMGTYEGETDSYYQLAINPATLISAESSNNYLFLLDFEEPGDQGVSGNQVYQALEGVIKTNLNQNERFNVFLSGTHIKKASSHWINAENTLIEKAFDELGKEPVTEYSNLQLLLEETMEFTGDEAQNTTVILLSNSDNYSGNKAANTLYNYIKSLGHLPMFQVVDFYQGDQYAYFGNQYFYGNQYLFNLLSQNTGGNYKKYNRWSDHLSDVLNQTIVMSNPLITSFDLITGMDDGFCYGRFTLNAGFSKMFLNQTLIHMGKYHGTLPFHFQMSGIVNGEVFQVNRNITGEHVIPLDSLTEESWSGNYIASLESSHELDNQVIEEIIKESINERVLSRYTAFLALEPGMRDEIEDRMDDMPQEWEEEEWITTVEENVSPELKLKAFPNPFTNHIRIHIELPGEENWQAVNIQVYNHVGQLIKTFDKHTFNFDGSINITWDGTDTRGHSLGSGVYFLVVKGSDFTKTMKLMKK